MMFHVLFHAHTGTPHKFLNPFLCDLQGHMFKQEVLNIFYLFGLSYHDIRAISESAQSLLSSSIYKMDLENFKQYQCF